MPPQGLSNNFDNIITNTSCAEIDLDAKYLESSIVSNGLINRREETTAAEKERSESAEEKERGTAERNNSPVEMRANQGLTKKMF